MKRTTANNELTLRVWIREAKKFVDATFNGRVFIVHGEEIVLYPINVMAAAIGRERERIVEWEQQGLWPKPMWAVPDKRTKRWYSRAQILMVHDTHWNLCGGDYGLSVTRHFDHEEFFRRVKAAWRKVDGATIKAIKERAAS